MLRRRWRGAVVGEDGRAAERTCCVEAWSRRMRPSLPSLSANAGATLITIERGARGETNDDELQFQPVLELGDAGDDEAAEDGYG